MTDEHSKNHQEAASRFEAPPTYLFVAYAVSMVLSISICLTLMWTLVGGFDSPDAILGLSPENFTLSMVFSLVAFTPAALMSSVVFVLAKAPRKWTALVPAALIPVLGGVVVFFVLLGGLST